MFVEKIINDLIDREGGYVNNSDDRGGPTNFGITLREYQRHHPGATIVDLKTMPRQEAFDIYVSIFYHEPGFDKVAELSTSIAVELIDTAVNMGINTAGVFCQRVLNVFNNGQSVYSDVVIDGSIGPASLKALSAFLQYRGSNGESVFLKALNCLQGARYIELAERRQANESFIFGWLDKRVSL